MQDMPLLVAPVALRGEAVWAVRVCGLGGGGGDSVAVLDVLKTTGEEVGFFAFEPVHFPVPSRGCSRGCVLRACWGVTP